jgi:hypothetical protein
MITGTPEDVQGFCKSRPDLAVSEHCQSVYITPTKIKLEHPNDEGIVCRDNLDGSTRCTVMTDNDQWGPYAIELLGRMAGTSGKVGKADTPKGEARNLAILRALYDEHGLSANEIGAKANVPLNGGGGVYSRLKKLRNSNQVEERDRMYYLLPKGKNEVAAHWKTVEKRSKT